MKIEKSGKICGMSRSCCYLVVALLMAAFEADSATSKPDYNTYQAPEVFSYAELVTLSNTEPPRGMK
jgi:hypothetical protein